MIRTRLEFKLAYFWIGFFAERKVEESCQQDSPSEVAFLRRNRVDVWVCILPFLPIHVVWVGRDTVQFVPFIGEPEIELDGTGWVMMKGPDDE